MNSKLECKEAGERYLPHDIKSGDYTIFEMYIGDDYDSDFVFASYKCETIFSYDYSLQNGNPPLDDPIQAAKDACEEHARKCEHEKEAS